MADIRALPGENCLIDAEVGLADLTGHYRLAEHWGVYVTFSAVSFNGGFGDSTIERFHDTFGFSNFGRTAAARDRVNVVVDLEDSQRVDLGRPTSGGLRDPVVGVRYSGFRLPERWNLVVEAAVPLPIDGGREFLSSGDAEPGLQATRRFFGARHALYLSTAAVHYGDDPLLPRVARRMVPTAIVGWEYRWSPRTHTILQGYASGPTRRAGASGLDELTGTKYQPSVGAYGPVGNTLLSFAVTENLQNLNNTPDIGLQLGWAYSPAALH